MIPGQGDGSGGEQQERDDQSDRSRLTLEEEGLTLDDPSKPGENYWV